MRPGGVRDFKVKMVPVFRTSSFSMALSPVSGRL
jgi:hypothetical protein